MDQEILNFIKKETNLSIPNQMSAQITVEGWVNLINKYHHKKLIERDAKIYSEHVNF